MKTCVRTLRRHPRLWKSLEKPIARRAFLFRKSRSGAVLTELVSLFAACLVRNVFTGGLNYHSVYECIPIPSLEAAAEVALSLVKLSAEVKTLK